MAATHPSPTGQQHHEQHTGHEERAVEPIGNVAHDLWDGGPRHAERGRHAPAPRATVRTAHTDGRHGNAAETHVGMYKEARARRTRRAGCLREVMSRLMGVCDSVSVCMCVCVHMCDHVSTLVHSFRARLHILTQTHAHVCKYKHTDINTQCMPPTFELLIALGMSCALDQQLQHAAAARVRTFDTNAREPIHAARIQETTITTTATAQSRQPTSRPRRSDRDNQRWKTCRRRT